MFRQYLKHSIARHWCSGSTYIFLLHATDVQTVFTEFYRTPLMFSQYLQNSIARHWCSGSISSLAIWLMPIMCIIPLGIHIRLWHPFFFHTFASFLSRLLHLWHSLISVFIVFAFWRKFAHFSVNFINILLDLSTAIVDVRDKSRMHEGLVLGGRPDWRFTIWPPRQNY